MSLEILLGWVTVVIQLGEYYDWGSNLQVSSYFKFSFAGVISKDHPVPVKHL